VTGDSDAKGAMESPIDLDHAARAPRERQSTRKRRDLAIAPFGCCLLRRLVQ
jgi:hypothetical protein